MNVTLHHGDALAVLQTMPDACVDAVVTDPPAGIGFMGVAWDTYRKGGQPRSDDEWDISGSKEHARHGNEQAHIRRKQGVAFRAFLEPVMAELYRVLKPGGHALVWAIPRTSHWTATAIEDAGFEVRDVVTHHFGSGFPKSLDVSKAIDKMGWASWTEFARVFADAVKRSGMNYTEVDRRLGVRAPGASSCYWARTDHRGGLPARHHWKALKEILALPDDLDRLYEAAEREVVGHRERSGKPPQPMWGEGDGQSWNITAPATEAAQQWQGWGTALKPASEHWILARRPLSEPNVAANVLRHGTGALNVDGCRVSCTDKTKFPTGYSKATGAAYAQDAYSKSWTAGEDRNPSGRWPANLVLSHAEGCRQVGTRRVQGSAPASGPTLTGPSTSTSRGKFNGVESTPSYAAPDGTETVPAWDCAEGCPVAELDRQSGDRPGFSGGGTKGAGFRDQYVNGENQGNVLPATTFSDHGGASRFFYTAKADGTERNAGLEGLEPRERKPYEGGMSSLSDPRMDHQQARRAARNTHPTVKSTDLMRWLCRLITPPGGTVLDCFMGSGSTGVAAKLEGFAFIGIEREAEYVEIAKRRLDWAVHEPTLFELDPDS